MLEIDTIYTGDCLTLMKGIEDKSVDLVLTDPPYGINVMKNVHSKQGKLFGNSACKRGIYGNGFDDHKLSIEYFAEIFRISKNQIIFGGNYYSEYLPSTRAWIIWDKKNDDKFKNDFADCEMIWTSFDRVTLIYRYLWVGMIQENMKNKEERYHPCQKPVSLITRILDEYTNKGDLICDPFLGSGTTAVACINSNRHIIGIELDPTYADIARQRVKDAQAQLRLF